MAEIRPFQAAQSVVDPSAPISPVAGFDTRKVAQVTERYSCSGDSLEEKEPVEGVPSG